MRRLKNLRTPCIAVLRPVICLNYILSDTSINLVFFAIFVSYIAEEEGGKSDFSCRTSSQSPQKSIQPTPFSLCVRRIRLKVLRKYVLHRIGPVN